MQHNIYHWAVAQVCDWVDYIGLGQYRKKFVHHCIDGRLLLSLTHKDLKVRLFYSAPHIAMSQSVASSGALQASGDCQDDAQLLLFACDIAKGCTSWNAASQGDVDCVL